MGISPGTLASAFLSQSLPSPGLSSQWFFFRPVRGQSPLGRKVLYRKSMCFQTKEGAQLLSVHTFPGFTGLPEGATAGSTLPEPSSPPLLSCLLKKQKKKKEKVCGKYVYVCVCVCVCVCIHISTSVYNPLLQSCLTSPSGHQFTALASSPLPPLGWGKRPSQPAGSLVAILTQPP